MTEDALPASYLDAIGWRGDAIDVGGAELRRGQFHVLDWDGAHLGNQDALLHYRGVAEAPAVVPA